VPSSSRDPLVLDGRPTLRGWYRTVLHSLAAGVLAALLWRALQSLWPGGVEVGIPLVASVLVVWLSGVPLAWAVPSMRAVWVGAVATAFWAALIVITVHSPGRGPA
jgi:Na+-driven multidrug efflux pump